MVGCFVPHCKSGHKKGKKSHMFRPPKDVRDQWKTLLIKLRSDKAFDFSNPSHTVCHLHFHQKEILKTWDHLINGCVHQVERKNWTLRPGSIPSIFPDIPKYLHPKSTTPRREIKRKMSSLPHSHTKKTKDEINEVSEQSTTSSDAKMDLWYAEIKEKVHDNWMMHKEGDNWTMCDMKIVYNVPTITKSITFSDFTIVRATFGSQDVTERITGNLSCCVTTLEDLLKVLDCMSKLKQCGGLKGFPKLFSSKNRKLINDAWFSNQCEIVGERTTCTACLRLLPTLQNQMSKPIVRQRSKATPTKDNKLLRRFQRRITTLSRSKLNLQREFNALKKKFKISNFAGCLDFVNKLDLHQNQRDAISHTLKAIKAKSATGKRYSSGWLLECLLLQIKSPAAYRHLRECKMLPLPHFSTLQRLISHERCHFGFSKSSLEAIRREYTNLKKRDRQGSLIFDEVKLRESLDFNRQTHKLDGFIDYGDENVDLMKNEQNKYANHALVMMFRPMNANWVQPIAAFATRDAAKGDILAKLVLQAVIKLESVGAEVLNVVCDGAKPNRKMWTCFGIDGESENVTCKILHPCNEDRYLYFTSDVPHLFKCVRNHFLKYGDIQFNGQIASFSHYEKLYLYENALAPGLRLCPKLSQSHIYPNNFERMVVPFATQLFSNHVGRSLTFYRDEGFPGFEDCTGTAYLTFALNNVFDALNAKIPSQGIRPNTKSYLVLQVFLAVVTRELFRRKTDRRYKAFASDETLIGFRVTLSSTIEITDYLVNNLQFHYVLTVKFNQDALEKFFGLIRAAGGREEHPTIKNFLHLYRLLSMYTPCKRILRGNIRDNSTGNDETVLCSFRTGLRKSAVELQAKQRKIDDEIYLELKQNIDNCDTNKVNSHLEDHNYAITVTPGFHQNDWNGRSGTINKKIVFHLSGYLAFKFRKLATYAECIKTLYVPCGSQMETEYCHVVDLLNRGPLHYPSNALFRFVVYALEPAICQMVEKSSFFGDMLLECIRGMPSINISDLGCSVEGHKHDLLCQLVPFYIKMRLDFWCRSMKDKVGKGKCTKAKRKESKLV